MDTSIGRAEHEEFCRRIEAENARLDDENKRQNRRLQEIEENVRQIGALTTSVEKLASSMENMVREQEKQGKRLETLESRDGEKWRQAIGYVIATLISLVLGYFFAQLGF